MFASLWVSGRSYCILEEVSSLTDLRPSPSAPRCDWWSSWRCRSSSLARCSAPNCLWRTENTRAQSCLPGYSVWTFSIKFRAHFSTVLTARAVVWRQPHCTGPGTGACSRKQHSWPILSDDIVISPDSIEVSSLQYCQVFPALLLIEQKSAFWNVYCIELLSTTRGLLAKCWLHCLNPSCFA